MRDRKISILLFVSFLLLLASFLILCTWVYNYYSRDEGIAKTIIQPATKPSDTRDSLLQIYTYTIQSLENKLGTTWSRSDSMEKSLMVKLDEYYRLKNELASLLKNPTSTDDFKTAKQKITELQIRIAELRDTNSDVEAENAKLYKLLAQINRDRISTPQNIQYVESPTFPNQRNVPETPVATSFSTADLSLTATNDTEENDPFSTQRKIIGSFALIHAIDLHNSDVMIIIIQPNGQVLQKSAWESGSFQTRDGKKIYSLKMGVDYTKGEAKKVTFSISTDKFVRGNYNMYIYNNGIMIGRLSRNLS